MRNTNTYDLLKSLQDLYANKKYEDGITLLIDNKDQFDKAQFHYNLGTFYAKLGNLAAGRYNLEKSLLEGAVGSEVFHNLRNVKKQLQVQDLSNSPFLGDRFVDFGLSMSNGSFLLVTLIMIIATLSLFRLKIIKKMYIFIFLIIFSIVPIGYKVFYLQNFTYGVTLIETDVFEGPSQIFDSTRTLSAGSKIVVGKIKPGWFFISHPIDASGWIKNKTLALY